MLPPEPQLCFGQVRHTRLRPALHAFEYGHYFLRLPLRTLGARDFGCALFSRNRFNLLSFHDADHGGGSGALLDWIDTLMRAEGVPDADGEVWLQTMPRVLGFVFNPVSFWFCHRRDGALRAVLCDVRNTFGERHCYLLDQWPGARRAQGVPRVAVLRGAGRLCIPLPARAARRRRAHAGPHRLRRRRRSCAQDQRVRRGRAACARRRCARFLRLSAADGGGHRTHPPAGAAALAAPRAFLFQTPASPPKG
jgi:hypothetical protein